MIEGRETWYCSCMTPDDDPIRDEYPNGMWIADGGRATALITLMAIYMEQNPGCPDGSRITDRLMYSKRLSKADRRWVSAVVDQLPTDRAARLIAECRRELKAEEGARTVQ
jgi:hypothetical protein